jgi:hypothetical protein
MIKKGIKLFGIAIAGVVIIVLATATLFINLSPQFGGSPSKAQQQQYAKSAQYKDGIFINAIPTTRDIGFVKTVRVLYDLLFNEHPGREPASPPPSRNRFPSNH